MSLLASRLVVLLATCGALAAAGCGSSGPATPSAPTPPGAATTPPDPPPPTSTTVVQGTLSGLSGACPNVSFFLLAPNSATVKIVADASTLYTGAGGACSTLRFAQRMNVTGLLRGTTLTATQIQQLPDKDT